jgi:hypothetical protein
MYNYSYIWTNQLLFLLRVLPEGCEALANQFAKGKRGRGGGRGRRGRGRRGRGRKGRGRGGRGSNTKKMNKELQEEKEEDSEEMEEVEAMNSEDEALEREIEEDQEKVVEREMRAEESGEESGEESEVEHYEIQKIVGNTWEPIAEGTVPIANLENSSAWECRYQIRWKGFSKDEDTYMNETGLLADAKEILKRYHQSKSYCTYAKHCTSRYQAWRTKRLAQIAEQDQPDDPSVGHSPVPVVQKQKTDYEMQREENIALNNKKLEELGLMSSSTSSTSSTSALPASVSTTEPLRKSRRIMESK